VKTANNQNSSRKTRTHMPINIFASCSSETKIEKKFNENEKSTAENTATQTEIISGQTRFKSQKEIHVLCEFTIHTIFFYFLPAGYAY